METKRKQENSARSERNRTKEILFKVKHKTFANQVRFVKFAAGIKSGTKKINQLVSTRCGGKSIRSHPTREQLSNKSVLIEIEDQSMETREQETSLR